MPQNTVSVILPTLPLPIKEYGRYWIFPWLAPRRGLHYLIARTNTIVQEHYLTDEDPAPIFAGYYFLYPFFERVFEFELTWKQLVTEDKAKKLKIIPLTSYTKHIDREQPGALPAVQNMCLIQRVETVYFLFDLEVHPLLLDHIVTKDGGELQFVFVYTLQIHSARKIMVKRPKGDFLIFADAEIRKCLREEYTNQTFDNARGVQKADVFNKEQEEEFIKKINDNAFAEEGWSLAGLVLEMIIVSKDSQKRISKEQEVEIAKLDKDITITNATAEGQAMKIKGSATAEVVDQVGTAEANVFGKKLDKLYDYKSKKAKLVDSTIDVATKNIGSTTGALTFAGGALFGDDSRFEDAIVANQIQTNLEKNYSNKKKRRTDDQE